MLRLLFVLHAATRLAAAARREAVPAQPGADRRQVVASGILPTALSPAPAVAPAPGRPDGDAAA